ncbi:MAG TPA: hypothetical protein VF691_17370, partial [Cytophagaceae bacterium]
MKKFFFPLYMGVFALLLVLSSCGKKKEDPKPGPKPTLSFTTSQGLVTGDVIVAPDEVIKIAVNITTSGSSLKTLKVDRDNNKIPEFNNNIDTKTISGTNYTEIITINTPSTESSTPYKYNFTATAEDGQSSTTTLQVTIAKPLGPKVKFSPNQILGVQTNPSIGSFYEVQKATVYNTIEA